MLAQGIEVLAFFVLVVVAAVVTGRHRADDAREGARYAAWGVLLVALNPLSMGHNGVILALPIVLIGLALAADQRIWPKLIWAAGVVLASIPRQALVSARPVPTDPWEGVGLIALPLWGTLLLFVAAAAGGARSAVAPAAAPARIEVRTAGTPVRRYGTEP
jgi:hypothetical protein